MIRDNLDIFYECLRLYADPKPPTEEKIMKKILYAMILIYIWILIGGFHGIATQIERDAYYIEECFFMFVEKFHIADIEHY
jgi:hypothetical protein